MLLNRSVRNILFISLPLEILSGFSTLARNPEGMVVLSDNRSFYSEGLSVA